MPPPPPRPGVIPLGPLGLGDILGGAFSTLGRHWKQLFGVALVAYGIGALVTGGAFAASIAAVHEHIDPVFRHRTVYESGPASSDVVPVVLAGAVAFLVAMAMWVVAMALMSSATATVLQDAVLGRRAPFGAVWRRTWSRFPAALGTLALTFLITAGAMLLFAGLMLLLMLPTRNDHEPPVAQLVLAGLGFLALIPFTIWMTVRFGFAPVAAVLENQRPVEALRRSARLVKGAWWRTFGIVLLVGMIAMVMGNLVQMPFTYGGILAVMPLMLAGSSGGSVGAVIAGVVIVLVLYLVGMVISQFLSTTLPQLAAGLLYIDQRIRREELAPTLAAAAGATPGAAPPVVRW
ncbi:hypothetical protein [Streptomyces sp. NBC_00083]|uniref:hypothetical protein n=1 Tax=Streptomyces sp. NBC_00083 TaxID=2975647 RepID=UPI002252EF9A|nr:hypothetical protein [Streptomyces sp. NBC_00083]MCX5383152.1 hypothetical protein [Streptomyces sp. NBC_00083]